MYYCRLYYEVHYAMKDAYGNKATIVLTIIMNVASCAVLMPLGMFCFAHKYYYSVSVIVMTLLCNCTMNELNSYINQLEH